MCVLMFKSERQTSLRITTSSEQGGGFITGSHESIKHLLGVPYDISLRQK